MKSKSTRAKALLENVDKIQNNAARALLKIGQNSLKMASEVDKLSYFKQRILLDTPVL